MQSLPLEIKLENFALKTFSLSERKKTSPWWMKLMLVFALENPSSVKSFTMEWKSAEKRAGVMDFLITLDSLRWSINMLAT